MMEWQSLAFWSFGAFAAFLCVSLAFVKGRTGSASDREIAQKLSLALAFAAVLVLLWMAQGGTEDSFSKLSGSHGRLRLIVFSVFIYLIFYAVAFGRGLLRSGEVSDALSVLDFFILAAWTSEMQKLSDENSWVAFFYAIPFGYMATMWVKARNSGEKDGARKWKGSISIGVLAFIITFFIEYHNPDVYWLYTPSNVSWKFWLILLVSLCIGTLFFQSVSSKSASNEGEGTGAADKATMRPRR